MSSQRGDLFNSLYKAHLRAYPFASKETNQGKAVTFWNSEKQSHKDDKEFTTIINGKIEALNRLTPQSSGKSLLNYFNKVSSKSVAATSDTASTSARTHANSDSASTSKSSLVNTSTVSVIESEKPNLKRKIYSAPSQDETKKKIAAIESQITSLTMMRDTNLGGSDVNEKISKARIDLKKTQNELKIKQKNAESQKKFREKQKKKVSDISGLELNVENSNVKVGRPRKEIEYPELLKTICDIAIVNSAADERRQTEQIRTCSTLDELTKKLQENGFYLSRSAVYLRLMPKRSNTHEGMRHVNTVPVRLCKPQNDLHKSHADGKFCTATIRGVDTLAAILGPKQVAYLSQDDKAKVKIGITAANKQTSKLMHVEYRVKLPDHDWNVANKHSLIPSVYAGIDIKENSCGSAENVTYSGPTYIAIRSGKHSSSTASTHCNDIDELYQLEGFKNMLYYNEETKPVLIISVDGGPDENPRYHKTIAYAIRHFQKYALDALFIMTNAPGRSAFNRVERRMAPLSRALSGIILPHNYHGDHLNSRKETEDGDLEKKNFAKAGEILQEIWSEMIIDKFPVVAKYINPDETIPSIPNIDWIWHKEHVRESQYFLQIVKCNNRSCCSEFRSDLNLILHDRFFPAPLLTRKLENGRLQIIENPLQNNKDAFFLPSLQRLLIDIPFEQSDFFKLPYDYHCPSVQESLTDRVCSFCDVHFSSIKNLKDHRKVLHPSGRQNKKIAPEKVLQRRDDEALCIIKRQDSYDASIITSIIEWLKSDWSNDV